LSPRISASGASGGTVMAVKRDVKEGSDTGAGYSYIPSVAGIVWSVV